MLFWHKHNIEKSLADLPNFTPFPDEWTVEDKVLFEQAFSFHGKTFHRIQQMVRTMQEDCLPRLSRALWVRGSGVFTQVYLQGCIIYRHSMAGAEGPAAIRTPGHYCSHMQNAENGYTATGNQTLKGRQQLVCSS